MRWIMPVVLVLAPAYSWADSFKSGVAQTWSTSFQNGEATAGGSSTLLGIGVANNITIDIGWYSEVGISIPTIIFHPSPRAYSGPVFRWGKLVFNPAPLYQFNPPYADKPPTHVIALATLTGVAITKEVTMAMLLGVGKSSPGPWAISFGPKLSFQLPF